MAHCCVMFQVASPNAAYCFERVAQIRIERRVRRAHLRPELGTPMIVVVTGRRQVLSVVATNVLEEPRRPASRTVVLLLEAMRDLLESAFSAVRS